MNFKKLTALILIAVFVLCTVSCGKDNVTTVNQDDDKETSPTDTVNTAEITDPSQDKPDDNTQKEEETTKPDVSFGEPTDSFELPSDSEKIVGTWKLSGADAQTIDGLEIWRFDADGTFTMINTDKNGKVEGNKIDGQYRIKDGVLTVTMMGMPLTYESYEIKDKELVLRDHGSEMTLEKYTGTIKE